MAPEQFGSKAKIKPATDGWALGALLYEALSGERPFVGESLVGLVAAIERGAPPPPNTRIPGSSAKRGWLQLAQATSPRDGARC